MTSDTTEYLVGPREDQTRDELRDHLETLGIDIHDEVGRLTLVVVGDETVRQRLESVVGEQRVEENKDDVRADI